MLYYYLLEVDFVGCDDLTNLMSFIQETIDEIDDKTPSQVQSSIVYYENTKESIRIKSQTISRVAQIKV